MKIIKKIIDKKLDKRIKSSILNMYLISSDFKKYFSRNISKNLVKKSRSLIMGVMSPKTLRSKFMKAKKDIFERTMWMWLSAALLIAFLTACGGGGGGAPAGPTPPTGGGSGTDTVVVTTPTMTVTYTATTSCASGPNLTSTVSQAAADALVPSSCPTVPTVGVAVSIATDMLAITGLPGGVNVASSTVTMVSGASTVVFVNGAITSGTLLSNAVYNYTGGQVAFVNAPMITIAGSVTSPVIPPVAVVCTAPAMLSSANTCVSPPAASGYTWNAAVKVWVADRGIYVVDINTLPATCLNIGDACYLANAADGTIKFVQGPTSVMFAVYQTADGYLNRKPLNNDGTPNNVGTSLLSGGSSGNLWDYVVGTEFGIIQKVTTPSECFEFTFTTIWGNSAVTCPVGP